MTEEEEYNKYILMVNCIASPLFFLVYTLTLSFSLFGIPLIIPLACLSIILCILVFFTSHKKKVPKYDLVIGIFGFLMSILWINIICNILMNFLELLALISGLR